jgi:hypothetical protein
MPFPYLPRLLPAYKAERSSPFTHLAAQSAAHDPLLFAPSNTLPRRSVRVAPSSPEPKQSAGLLDSPDRTSSEAGQYLYGEHDDELLGRRLSPVPDNSWSAAAPHCIDSPLSLFASKIRPLQFAPADGEHIRVPLHLLSPFRTSAEPLAARNPAD